MELPAELRRYYERRVVTREASAGSAICRPCWPNSSTTASLTAAPRSPEGVHEGLDEEVPAVDQHEEEDLEW